MPGSSELMMITGTNSVLKNEAKPPVVMNKRTSKVRQQNFKEAQIGTTDKYLYQEDEEEEERHFEGNAKDVQEIS
jgi:hypothetical protein